MKTTKWVEWTVLLLPLSIGLLTIFLNNSYSPVVASSMGLDNIFNHFISFSSIIVGVLIALFSVIIALDDSALMKELKKMHAERLLIMLGAETLLWNLILLVYTIVLQFLVSDLFFENILNKLISVCIGIAVATVISSIRTTFYFLIIPLNQEGSESITKGTGISKDDEEKLQEKYAKK